MSFWDWLTGTAPARAETAEPAPKMEILAPVQLPAPLEVTVTREREYSSPNFERMYRGKVGHGHRVEIRYTDLFRPRHGRGTATQPNGRSISFDPDNLADALIAPEVLPEIERFCRQARGIDDAWINGGGRNEYVDGEGVRWIRASTLPQLPDKRGGEN